MVVIAIVSVLFAGTLPSDASQPKYRRHQQSRRRSLMLPMARSRTDKHSSCTSSTGEIRPFLSSTRSECKLSFGTSSTSIPCTISRKHTKQKRPQSCCDYTPRSRILILADKVPSFAPECTFCRRFLDNKKLTVWKTLEAPSAGATEFALCSRMRR